MPGLRLTQREAERLWGLDAHVCEALFDALVAISFLRRTGQGEYVRADIGRKGRLGLDASLGQSCHSSSRLRRRGRMIDAFADRVSRSLYI